MNWVEERWGSSDHKSCYCAHPNTQSSNFLDPRILSYKESPGNILDIIAKPAETMSLFWNNTLLQHCNFGCQTWEGFAYSCPWQRLYNLWLFPGSIMVFHHDSLPHYGKSLSSPPWSSSPSRFPPLKCLPLPSIYGHALFNDSTKICSVTVTGVSSSMVSFMTPSLWFSSWPLQ